MSDNKKPAMIVLFDGGGTLWDSLPLLYASYVTAFAAVEKKRGMCEGLGYSPKLCHRLRGLPGCSGAEAFEEVLLNWRLSDVPESEAAKLITEILRRESLPDVPKALIHSDPVADSVNFSKEFTKHIAHHEKVVDPKKYPTREGARTAAAELAKMGMDFRLVSNRDEKSTMDILSGPGLRVWAEEAHYVYLEKQPKESRHAAAILQNIVQAGGYAQKHVYFVGDSVVDMIAGNHIGAQCIGLTGGMSPETDLRKAGAHVIAAELSDVLRHLTALAADRS